MPRDVAVAVALFATALLAASAWLRWVGPASPGNEHHRERYLDGVRGLAAVAVMASHYGGQIAYAIAGHAPSALFHNLGTAGVQVFFALTGFLFTRKAVAARGQLALRPFFLARLRRIVPMYTAAVAFAVALVCAVTWREPIDLARLARQVAALYSFGFVQGGAPRIKDVGYEDVLGTIWSLPFEWLFYLGVPVLAALVASRLSVAVAGAVLAVYFGLLMTDGRGDVFCPFFLPGIAMGLLLPLPLWEGAGGRGRAVPGLERAAPLPPPPPTRGGGFSLRSLAAAAAIMLAGAALLPGPQDFTPSRLLLMTLLFGSLVLARPALLAWRPVAFLGDISYSLYLMHLPLLYASRAVLAAFDPQGTTPLAWAAAMLAMSGATVGVCAVTYRTIERPFLRRFPA